MACAIIRRVMNTKRNFALMDAKVDHVSAAMPQHRQEATRRGFLKSAVAFGGLVATSRLPVFADDVSLFRGRGMFERLSLVSRHIDAGAERPFSVLHISDTHLTAAYPHESEWTRSFMEKRVRVFGGWQEEALRDSLSWAKCHVDYVVHTGDLIDGQSEANFDLVRKYYGEGGASMFGSLGNHEYYHGQKVENEETKSETRDRLAAAYPFDISFQSTVVNGVNFVTLDDVYNAVTADQAGKFEAEVKKGLPIVLCMHCPFGSPRIWRAADKFWNSKNFKAVPDLGKYKAWESDAVTREFIAYLRAQPLLKAILAGHLHVTVEDRFSPTAMQYVVGGNFLFHGAEITIS